MLSHLTNRRSLHPPGCAYEWFSEFFSQQQEPYEIKIYTDPQYVK